MKLNKRQLRLEPIWVKSTSRYTPFLVMLSFLMLYLSYFTPSSPPKVAFFLCLLFLTLVSFISLFLADKLLVWFVPFVITYLLSLYLF